MGKLSVFFAKQGYPLTIENQASTGKEIGPNFPLFNKIKLFPLFFIMAPSVRWGRDQQMAIHPVTYWTN
jgi:hypothetical protein